MRFVRDNPATSIRSAVTELWLMEDLAGITPPRFVDVAYNDVDGDRILSVGYVPFFVSAENDPPGAFFPSYPAVLEAVDSVMPTLEVTNSRDPDEDGLTYHFEVFSDVDGDNSVAGSPQIDAGVSGTTSWTVDTALTSGQTYYWRVTATDPQGGAEETELIPFVVDTTNGAPSTLAIESPPSGSVVATRAVDVVVSNADDPDGDARTYAFQLDTVNTFDSPDRLSVAGIAEGAGSTSWKVTDLGDETLYFWRAKAAGDRRLWK